MNNVELELQTFKLQHTEKLQRAEHERLVNTVLSAKRVSRLAQLGRMMVILVEQLQERYNETRNSGADLPIQQASAEA